MDQSARAAVRSLQDRPHAQVLIIGGGINGISTFRELALQGVDVALVERGDYASGASAASSHMIHGGIRYLENGEFRLVRESVTERNGLLKIAPHYVKPLRTTIPIFTTFSGILTAPLRFLTHRQGKPKERGALLIQVGLIIYDTFSRAGHAVPWHKFRGRRAALRDLPRLNPELKYTATYFDGSIHEPERLALDVLGDGLITGNGRAANYVRAVGANEDGVLLRDEESGEEFPFTADLVINASGPWTDLTNEALGTPSSFMGGTKGSHIVLDNPDLADATGGREIFFENSDGRIVLIYPLKGRVLVGTTDTEVDIRTDELIATDDEIEYFFDLIGHVFPDVRVSREQIVYTFAGVRPLPKHEDTAPGFVSRDYRIVPGTLPGGTRLLSLVGGKWTTFRALGEQLADRALQAVRVPREVDTRTLPIGGGRGFPASPAERKLWVAEHRTAEVDASWTERLLNRYGTRAAAIIPRLTGADAEPMRNDQKALRGEVVYFAEHEQAVHLADVVLRRSNLAFVGGVTGELLEEIATTMAGPLGWDRARIDAEIADTVTVLRERHRVEVTTTESTVADHADAPEETDKTS